MLFSNIKWQNVLNYCRKIKLVKLTKTVVQAVCTWHCVRKQAAGMMTELWRISCGNMADSCL